MNKTYWKASKTTERKLREAEKDWSERVVPAANQLVAELGAANFVYSIGFFSMRVSGFAFNTPPDKNKCFPMKGLEGCWTPRSNTAIGKKMAKLTSSCIAEMKDMLGIGMKLEVMGVDFLRNHVLITWMFDNPPLGCKRISDIEFEKLMKKKKQ